MKHFPSLLAAALEGIPLSPDQLAKLAQHFALLQQWNSRTNLTAITSETEAAHLHYADSLAPLGHLEGQTVLDIGSGGGFPGIPLAIADPSRRYTLMEPRRKRVSFLKTAVSTLGLTHVEVLQARSDDLPAATFDCGVTRATFSDPADLDGCMGWLREGAPLIMLRSGPSGRADATITSYDLLGHKRVLETWIRPRTA